MLDWRAAQNTHHRGRKRVAGGRPNGETGKAFTLAHMRLMQSMLSNTTCKEASRVCFLAEAA